MDNKTEGQSWGNKTRSRSARTTAFFVPLILAAAFLNAGQSECSCNSTCTTPPAPASPQVIQVPQALSVDVTATLPASATGSQTVRVFRDSVLVGEVDADASGQATLNDSYNIEADVTYAYHVTYYEPPNGYESDPSQSTTITIDGSDLLPPPPSHGALGFLPPRDCGNQSGYERGEFTAVNVPLGAEVNLYRDDTLVAQGTASLPNPWFPLPGYEGMLTLPSEIYWRRQYPGHRYEYRFSYIDGNGIESQRSSPRTVTIPQCTITDFPSLEDGELRVGVYAVRFQDWPEVPWPVADMNRYFFCSDGDPNNPCPLDDDYGPNWYVQSIPVDVDYMTRGGLAVTGEVYGAADGSGFLTWPVNGADRCSGISQCGPPSVLASEVLAFVESQAHIPTENYEAHVILMQGWYSVHGGFNFSADEELGNLSMMRWQIYPGWEPPLPSQTGSNGLIHEAVVHGALGYGHGGSWDCSAIPDSDVGPSLEDMLAGGCTTGAGFQRHGGILKEKIGAYLPGEILTVTESGEYEVGHWGSSHAVKRLDIELGGHSAYTFEYRVPPREYDSLWYQYRHQGANGVLYAHFQPGSVTSGADVFQESFRIKVGMRDGMDLGPTYGDVTFDDPYRGIHLELLETTAEAARVRIDFD